MISFSILIRAYQRWSKWRAV